MSEKDVKDNLVSIIDSMDRIRNETAANLGASDEAKMDYLRLAGELAGCAKVLIKENKLEDYVSNLSNLMAKNSSLRNYDTNQNDFWADAEPRLKIALEDCGSVLLGDAFNNESQIYHVFQALKCLTMQDKESKEEALKKGKNPGSVSDFWNLNLKGSKEAHYASFNFALIERPIMAGCPKGGVVLDPFCGTATTGVRAIQLGRKFIGIDGSSSYNSIANRNLDKERLQPQMF